MAEEAIEEEPARRDCGSLLYDQKWRFWGLFDVELFDDMVEEAIEEGPARRDWGSVLYN